MRQNSLYNTSLSVGHVINVKKNGKTNNEIINNSGKKNNGCGHNKSIYFNICIQLLNNASGN